MFVTNWISPTKIQKISEITNFLGTISYPELRYCYTIYVSVIRFIIGKQIVVSVLHDAKILKRK